MCIRKQPTNVINVINVIRFSHSEAYIEYMYAHTLDPKFTNVSPGPVATNISGRRTYIGIYKHI